MESKFDVLFESLMEKYLVGGEPITQSTFLQMKLDNANDWLEQGMASEDDAKKYVEQWNKPGNRLTKLVLVMKSKLIKGVMMKVPVLVQ